MTSQELRSLSFGAATVLLLAACGMPKSTPALQGNWALQASATSGAALIRTERGSEALRIACRRNPADLLVVAPRLAGGSGPVRLQVGAAAFDLQAEADGPGLSAAGVLTPALPDALTSGGAIVLHQGDSATPAFQPPDAATAAAFADACRKALK